MPQFIHYLSIATTVLSAIFAVILLNRFRTQKQSLHLLWWGIGFVAFGIATGLVSALTLLGNSVVLTKAWLVAVPFVTYPLALGTAYLLLERKTADRLTAITLPIMLLVAVLIILSPVASDELEAVRPSARILAWAWALVLRRITGLCAVLFLVGVAIWSAYRFWRSKVPGYGQRAIGTMLMAIGTRLLSFGVFFAGMGYVEAMYLGEFFGLLFIWTGVVFNIRAPRPSLNETNAGAPAG